MKKCFYGFLVCVCCLLFYCCKTQRQTTDPYYNQPKNLEIQYVIDTIVGSHFVDSVCISDTIPVDYANEWNVLPLKDYETNKNVTQWMYFKPYQGTVYTRQHKSDSLWRFTKRIEIAK